jgi:excisionase family DNA binding protein
MKTQSSEKLLSVESVAEKLDLKASTIRKRILQKRIPYVKIGRSVRIPIEAVNELIAKGWREPITDAQA